MPAGMVGILGLGFLLASGILCVILSCALDNNWYPLLVVLTYLLAPLPNMISKRIIQTSGGWGGLDSTDSSLRSVQETGYFITSFFIVSGFGIPLVLYHASAITQHSMILSVVGGGLIYITMLGYVRFFVEDTTSSEW